MIYIDGDSGITELARVWIKDISDIEMGSSSDRVIQNIRAGVPCILIYPWGHLERNEKAEITDASKDFIDTVKKGINEKICILIGGGWEVEIFGNTVITERLSLRLLNEIVMKTKK